MKWAFKLDGANVPGSALSREARHDHVAPAARSLKLRVASSKRLIRLKSRPCLSGEAVGEANGNRRSKPLVWLLGLSIVAQSIESTLSEK